CRRARPPSVGPTRRTIAEESRSAASRPNRPADDRALGPADSAVPPPPATPATEPPRSSRPKISRDGCDASCSRNPDRKNSLDATFVRPNLARSPESHKTGQQGLINQRFPKGRRMPRFAHPTLNFDALDERG